jgi:hypothetical protein
MVDQVVQTEPHQDHKHQETDLVVVHMVAVAVV